MDKHTKTESVVEQISARLSWDKPDFTVMDISQTENNAGSGFDAGDPADLAS